MLKTCVKENINSCRKSVKTLKKAVRVSTEPGNLENHGKVMEFLGSGKIMEFRFLTWNFPVICIFLKK